MPFTIYTIFLFWARLSLPQNWDSSHGILLLARRTKVLFMFSYSSCPSVKATDIHFSICSPPAFCTSVQHQRSGALCVFLLPLVCHTKVLFSRTTLVRASSSLSSVFSVVQPVFQKQQRNKSNPKETHQNGVENWARLGEEEPATIAARGTKDYDIRGANDTKRIFIFFEELWSSKDTRSLSIS